MPLAKGLLRGWRGDGPRDGGTFRFLRLCKALHKRCYAKLTIMQRWPWRGSLTAVRRRSGLARSFS